MFPIRSILATAAVTAMVAVTAVSVAPAQAAPRWSRQQELWTTDGTTGAVGAAVSGSGRRAVVVATGKSADWTRGRWVPARRIPQGRAMYGVEDVQLSSRGNTAFALWIGDANEGVDDLYASVRVDGRWRTNQFGAGTAAGGLARNGAAAAVAWYDMDPDFGTTDHIYVQMWSGRVWGAVTDVALPAGEIGVTGRPQVAVSDDGSQVAVAWDQGGALQVAFWDGATWSAPVTGGVGSAPVAIRMTGAGRAAVLTGSADVDGELHLDVVTATAAGVTPPTSVGDVPALGVYSLDKAELDPAGTGGLVLFSGAGAGVATWSAGRPFAVTELGAVFAAADLAERGGSGLVTTMTDPTDMGAAPKVAVRSWNGAAWSAPKTIGRCVNHPLAAAVSGRGEVKAAAWTCGHLHAVHSPRR